MLPAAQKLGADIPRVAMAVAWGDACPATESGELLNYPDLIAKTCSFFEQQAKLKKVSTHGTLSGISINVPERTIQ
ncbi:hypothetical protein AU14_18875 [Marinobacter similis]|uniref:Uncharacterized protein n=2 Tax=Marinobacter similis TaxID=1420916 RepID=W5YMQ3_9GAMM|nr:hypothetical protein AU14_18875 [Marinobacter similis]